MKQFLIIMAKAISINNDSTEKLITKFLAFALLWLSPLAIQIFIVTVFIILDTIMGVVAAKKQGEEITSKKLRQGFIPKAIGYAVMITACRVLDTEVYFINAENLGVGFVAFAEMKSIDENLKKITGFSVWDKILEVIKNK